MQERPIVRITTDWRLLKETQQYWVIVNLGIFLQVSV
jgi:hypothetical protein